MIQRSNLVWTTVSCYSCHNNAPGIEVELSFEKFEHSAISEIHNHCQQIPWSLLSRGKCTVTTTVVNCISRKTYLRTRDAGEELLPGLVLATRHLVWQLCHLLQT